MTAVTECSCCHQLKPIEEYARSGERGRQSRCRACFNAWYKERHLTPHGRAVDLFNNAKCRAKKIGVPFTITLEWVEDRILAGACEVTGLRLSLDEPAVGRSNPLAPSLDRIFQTDGYTPDNTRVVAWIYNRCKNDSFDCYTQSLIHAMSAGIQCLAQPKHSSTPSTVS